MTKTQTQFTPDEMHHVAVVLEDAVADCENDGWAEDELRTLRALMDKAWTMHAEMTGDA